VINSCYPVPINDIPFVDVVDGVVRGDFCGVVVTPNVDHMCRIFSDDSYKKLYLNSKLCVCDSKILQYISLMRGEKIENVVRGSDLVVEVLKRTSERKILIVGSSDNQASLVASKFGHAEVGIIVPKFGFINDRACVDNLIRDICSREWDLAFFAVGSPQQEILAYKVFDNISNPDERTVICCGNHQRGCLKLVLNGCTEYL
jgi:N-acetylglucosaminyldiphosphoundecaprenol N-acetyl-beta-D-mannosaminyltransferase